MRIFPHECIEPRYVFHSLRNLRTSLIDQAQGGAQPNISNGIIKQTEIPVAPLPEQRRIVAKIEALQERSGRAAKALEEVGPLLEQFRQSILAAPSRTPHRRLARKEPQRRTRPRTPRPYPHRTPPTMGTSRTRQYEAKGKQPPKDWKDKYEEPEPVNETDLQSCRKAGAMFQWTKLRPRCPMCSQETKLH